MKNFKNCEPFKLQRDLRQLIDQHNEQESLRKIEAYKRLTALHRELEEVTAFIAAEGTQS